LCYRWEHPDPRVDALQREVEACVQESSTGTDRRSVYCDVWRRLHRVLGSLDRPLPHGRVPLPRTAVPFLNEPWYC
jgi:hypothetical protein